MTTAPTAATMAAIQIAFAAMLAGKFVPPVSALSPGNSPEIVTRPSAKVGPMNRAAAEMVRFSPAINTSSCLVAAPRARMIPDSVSRSSRARAATSTANERLATAKTRPIASIKLTEIDAASMCPFTTSSIRVIRWNPNRSCCSCAPCALNSARIVSASRARIESALTGSIV